MHPLWKSRKFSFRLLVVIVFLIKIASTNANVLRQKRETASSVGNATTPSTHVMLPATVAFKVTTETIADDIDADEFDLFAAATPPEVIDGGDTAAAVDDDMLILDKNQLMATNTESATIQETPLRQQVLHANVSSIKIDKVVDTDVTLTTTANDILANLQVSSSTKAATNLPPSSTKSATESQKSIAILRSATTEAFVATTESEIVTTLKEDGIKETVTTENSIDSNTKIAETTPETAENFISNRASTENMEETTIATTNEPMTLQTIEPDAATTIHDQLVNEIKTTTDGRLDTTNRVDRETTAQPENETVTTTESNITKNPEKSLIDSINYDIRINEIKSNASIKEVEPRSKYTKKPELVKPIDTPSSIAITTTSKPATDNSNHTGELKENDHVEYITSSNHSFTSGPNSIENTLENGLVENSAVKKVGNEVIAADTGIRQAIKLSSTTVATNEIGPLSTPSIEKNKVEDTEDASPKPTEKLDSKTSLLTKTVSNPLPASTTVTTQQNETETPVDTTTKRVERSTSVPTTMETRRTLKITTTNFTPLSTISIERDHESTTPTDDYITTDRRADTNSLTTSESVVPITSEKVLLTSDSALVESRLSTITTSTVHLETFPLATTNPGSTIPAQASTIDYPISTTEEIMSTIKQIPRLMTNTTHIVSTEPNEIYEIQSRSNRTKESLDLAPSSIFSMVPISTTESQTATTEHVTTEEPEDTDVNVIIAISVSVVGIVALILLVTLLYVMRKRQKSISYGQRCRPVSLDAYSLDNVSIFNSVRRKGIMRASKRSYGNAAFDDPALKHNSMSIHELERFITRRTAIFDEYKDVPQITARPDEVPPGCEDKNRYANVIPLPETRVLLTRMNDDERTEYINANYVRGPKDPANYYIACQAPLESTVSDFWRMIWEQNSRVILMATDLVENEVEKCAEYLPPSMTLDNHTVYGDYQITLKNREVKEKYAVSTLHVKNLTLNRWREVTHFWYQWPETGVPNDEASVIAMLLEARSYLKMGTPEQSDDDEIEKKSNETMTASTSSLDKTKSLTKTQGPLTVHCSPGTGRTGTIISCDMALRNLETPKRIIDIPQIVYYVRRGRASAVQTKEQYEFIYKVAHMYARKISGPVNDN